MLSSAPDEADRNREHELLEMITDPWKDSDSQPGDFDPELDQAQVEIHDGNLETEVPILASRATEMRALLHHARPHGGNAAERAKQMRPRDPWVPSADLRRIRREASADSGLYADLDVVRRAELET